jgi:hypothetical protein
MKDTKMEQRFQRWDISRDEQMINKYIDQYRVQ